MSEVENNMKDKEVIGKEPWLAVVLSTFIWGAGQLYAGCLHKGFILIIFRDRSFSELTIALKSLLAESGFFSGIVLTLAMKYGSEETIVSRTILLRPCIIAVVEPSG